MSSNPDIEIGRVPASRRKARPTPVKSEKRSVAMKGNRNASKPEEERVVERRKLYLSWTHAREERLRNALLWHLGYVPEDAEVADRARDICYQALSEFCVVGENS